jgi:hypothetical protein
MGKILLDYAFPFSEQTGTPDASLAYLRKVAVIVLPLTPPEKGANANPTVPYSVEVYNAEEVAEHTANTALLMLFKGGLNAVTLIVTDTLANADALLDKYEFYTVGISEDFTEADATAFVPATYGGVIYSVATTMAGAVSMADTDKATRQRYENIAQTQLDKAKTAKGAERDKALEEYNKATKGLASTPNRSVFYDADYSTESAHFAFGALLSDTYWRDQQYIEAGGDWFACEALGEAESLFEARVSFWLADDEYGLRLAFFGVGGEGITYPYIKEEIRRVVQSNGLGYLSLNKSKNTASERMRLESTLQSVIDEYALSPYYYLDGGANNDINLFKSNERYTVTGQMQTTVAEPLWRVKIEAIQGEVA